MWLAKPVYEALPFYYLGAGVAAIVAGLFVDYGYWAEGCLAAGFVALVGGAVVLLKRRAYRASRSRLDFEEVEAPKLDPRDS